MVILRGREEQGRQGEDGAADPDEEDGGRDNHFWSADLQRPDNGLVSESEVTFLKLYLEWPIWGQSICALRVAPCLWKSVMVEPELL